MSVKIGIDINTGNKILILDNGNGGTASQIALLSITTAPSGSFAVGSKYYNSTDKKIYTAITADTWTGATSADPVFNTIYTFNSGYYIWDGNSLEETDLNKYELIANKTDSYLETSPTKYPSSKALSDGLASKNMPSSIITSSQKIAVKGLSCISNNTPKILAKADIPLTYAAVKTKYDSAETEQSDVAEIPLTDGVQHRCIYKENGEYFFSIYQNNIMKSTEPSLESPTLVLTSQTLLNEFLFYMGENANFILGNGLVAGENKTLIEVYTKSNVYVKTLNLDVAITDLSQYTKFKDIDGLVYLCTANALIRFADSVDITALELIYDSTSVKKVFAIEKLSNGKYVMPIIKADNTKCVRVVANGSDFSTFTENIPSGNYGNGANFDMILDGTTLCLANSGEKKYTSTDGETWAETNLPYINGVAFRLIKMGTTFKLIFSTTILSSTDFSGAFNVDKSFTISELDAVYSLYKDDTTLIFGERKLAYSGIIKKVFTDVWGETTISYYECIDTSCKICLPAQDTSLATIFQNYGQAPYFRLDTANETLTLPRIKNKYTYFQTLDTNYLESVDDMDSGDFSRNALATELNVFNEFTQTADKTFGNTTDETSIVGTGLGSVSFPANYFKYGKKLRITGWGILSGASGTSTTLKIKLGDTTIISSTSNLPTTLSNVKFDIAVDLTVRSTGTTGTVVCGGTTTIHASIGFGTATTRNFRTETPVVIDTTTALALDITYQFGVAAETNTITLSDLSVLSLN